MDEHFGLHRVDEGTSSAEGDERDPSERVVRSVAALLDTDPMTLPPLYSAIEPDSLDVLFADADRIPLLLRFEYAGTLVTFDRAGTLSVTELTE